MPAVQFSVHAEEVISSFADPNNGSGPLWCFGSSTIVRDGERVFATVPEVGENMVPLCNTRWQLLQRTDGGWTRVQAAGRFEEREPCPLARLPGGRLILSANRKLGWCYGTPGVYESHHAQPLLLEFDADAPDRPPVVRTPQWDREYGFTEHTYRGIAADPRTGEVILLHITGDAGHAWSLMDREGQFTHQGFVGFAERGCYPQVALRGRAAYVVAVSDIVEPNPAWREYKRQQTGKDWDYDFRMLYFTSTPDLTREPFSPVLTFASRDETAGLLTHQDLWVGPDGDAHAVYLDRSVWHPCMRDRFFPDTPLTVELKYCRIRHGAVTERRLLARAAEDRRALGSQDPAGVVFDAPVPTGARFHATGDGGLWVLYSLSAGEDTAMYCRPLLPDAAAAAVRVPLTHPLTTFFTATERLGTEPSPTVDLYGLGNQPGVVRYAQLVIAPA